MFYSDFYGKDLRKKDDNSRSDRQRIEKNNIGEHTAIASNLNRTRDRKNFRYSRFQNPELYLLRESGMRGGLCHSLDGNALFLLEIRGTTSAYVLAVGCSIFVLPLYIYIEREMHWESGECGGTGANLPWLRAGTVKGSVRH